MGPIDRFSPVPAYRQIADVLRGQISAGDVTPGEKLPSERELCETYDVDRGVVRRALALLQAWGLIVTEHGRGAFVRNHPALRRIARNRVEATRGRRWHGFYADVEDAGLAPSVTTEIRRQAAPKVIAEQLGVPEGSEVVVRARVMGAGGETLPLSTSYFPDNVVERAPRLEEPDTGPGGMFTLLEEAGYELHQEEAVSARMPLPEEARALQIGPGTPVMRILRRIFDQNGEPLEVCEMLLAADRYELVYNLCRLAEVGVQQNERPAGRERAFHSKTKVRRMGPDLRVFRLRPSRRPARALRLGSSIHGGVQVHE